MVKGLESSSLFDSPRPGTEGFGKTMAPDTAGGASGTTLGVKADTSNRISGLDPSIGRGALIKKPG